MNEKQCTKCKVIKPLDQFTRNKSHKTGYHSWCRECHNTWTRNNGRLHSQERMEYNRDYYRSMAGRLAGWKQSAKVRKIPFTLTLDDINRLPMTCSYTGTPLTMEPNRLNTVSLDRIDSNADYTPGNVCLAMQAVNTMKGELSVNHLKTLCEAVLVNHGYVIEPPLTA